MTRLAPTPLAALAFLGAMLPACTTVPAPAPDPQEAFWQALASHCGKAYSGALVSDQAADADMRGVGMTMHVRECSATRIAVPFHVQRADGTCLYHLASVVDDFHFQITHVIRAVEHLSNTPRQIFIAQSLGYPLPQYAHLPYVAEPGSPQKYRSARSPSI